MEKKKTFKVTLLTIFLILAIILIILTVYYLTISNTQENQSITNNSIIEDIIGEWYPSRVIWGEEERGLSNYYGIEITENNYFEFYSDGTYVKFLGTYNDKGSYQISGNYVYMTSNISGTTTVAQYCEGDYSGNDEKHLVELESGMVVFYLKAEK